MDIDVEFKIIENNKLGLWHTYDGLLDTLCFPGAHVLDLGCGWRNKSQLVRHEDRATCVGIDIDPMIRRQLLRLKVQSDAHKLPFTDDAFDLISSIYVLEHIAIPPLLFSEAFRILRKGGSFLLLTNSCYNPVVWFAKLFPQRWHRFIIQSILGQSERDYDNARVFYRANTCRSLIELCKEVGFASCKIIHLSGLYEYFGSLKVRRALFKIGNLLTDNSTLAFLKLNLVLVATK